MGSNNKGEGFSCTIESGIDHEQTQKVTTQGKNRRLNSEHTKLPPGIPRNKKDSITNFFKNSNINERENSDTNTMQNRNKKQIKSESTKVSNENLDISGSSDILGSKPGETTKALGLKRQQSGISSTKSSDRTY